MKKTYLIALFVASLAALFFLPFLGKVHLFDWDEINFAEISREMIELDHYLRIFINYEPFWQKPPLFFWLQVLSMKFWGINEYAARFPNAICGIITLVMLFFMGKRLYDNRFGLIWAGAYLGSLLPHLYFKSGIIDPWFNLFIFFGMYLFIMSYWKDMGYQFVDFPGNSLTLLVFSGLVLGLAILTKGPVAYLILFLCFFVYWIFKRFQLFLKIPELLLFTLSALAITAIWLGIETYRYGPWFALKFTQYQIDLLMEPGAGHKGFPGYHVVVLLLGCFPASIFAIQSMGKFKQPYTYQSNFRLWMIILLAVVVSLFSIVQSKIVHYSSLAYFPITYLGALTFHRILVKETQLAFPIQIGFWILAGIMVLTPWIVTYLGFHPDLLKSFFANNPFAEANLKAEVNWTGWEIIPGFWFLAVVLGIVFLYEKKLPEYSLTVLLGGTAIYTFLCLAFFVGRIERYSQGAAIDFYKSLKGKDAYVFASGYRSYAHLYYPAKKPPLDFDPTYTPILGDNPSFNLQLSSNEEWLYYKKVDKEVYSVARLNRAIQLQNIETLREIGRKNGYVFFKRVKGLPCQTWKKSTCPENTSCGYKIRYFMDFEPSGEIDCYSYPQIDSSQAFTGAYSWKLSQGNGYGYTLRVFLSEVKGNHAFELQSQVLGETLDQTKWVCTVQDKLGNSLHWEGIAPTQVEELANGWKKVKGKMSLPTDIPSESTLLLFLWNTGQKPIYQDDFQIDIISDKDIES
ncbi:MAG: glycosyltransferase family 39 protein [Bacteroidota bacterium]